MENQLHIDIREAFKQKLPKYSRYIPGFVYRYLERLIRQDELNRILLENKDKTGVDFASGALKSMNIGLTVNGIENLPESGRFVFASNHPLGGLDGIALISMLGKRYGKINCIVNDILLAVKPLNSIFLPVNKYGSQSRSSAKKIDEAYSGNGQMITFPAGLCSRQGDDGSIRDLKWQKSFIAKSVESRRDIIPVYFGGLNSRFFYKFARIRKKLGIKFNIELIFLPYEMIKSEGRTFCVTIGQPIPYSMFDKSRTTGEWAQYVKDAVYNLQG